MAGKGAPSDEFLMGLHQSLGEAMQHPEFGPDFARMTRELREQRFPRGQTKMTEVLIDGRLKFRVDLGDRLGRSGWLNVFVPSVSVMHAKSHSVSRHPEKMIPAHHASAYRFTADRNPGPLRAPIRLALRAGLAVRSKIAVAAALREQRRTGGPA